MESLHRHPLPYRRLLAPHARPAGQYSGSVEKRGTFARKKYVSGIFQRTSFLAILLLGAISSLYLVNLNQDMRQQASGHSATPVLSTPTDSSVFPPAESMSPLLFSELASLGNTASFVVLPEKLGYDPDTIQVHINRAFSPTEDTRLWAREFSWTDTSSQHEYSSAVWSFAHPVQAEKAHAEFNSRARVVYLDATQLHLRGIPPEQTMLFETNDSEKMLVFSLYLRNYCIVLTTKNVSFETALKNMEIMANLLIEDLALPHP